MTEQEKQKLLELSQISLWLDDYDDIFSDFDPRPYAQRALSDDFLSEARKASRDKTSGKIELRFLVPAAKCQQAHETTIKKRLREHFKKHHDRYVKDYHVVIRQGIQFAAAGVVIMFLTTFLLLKSGEKNILLNFLIVLLEPAGWFLFWEGLNLAIFQSKSKKPEVTFYEKMAACEVVFATY